jgi:hypothetical protein
MDSLLLAAPAYFYATHLVAEAAAETAGANQLTWLR